jgi:AraC family transcriptional regulator
MEVSSADEIHIDAEQLTPIGRVQILRRIWRSPIDTIGRPRNHRIELCLLPRLNPSRACFPERWGAHRFEPVGDLFLLPDQQAVHARSECRRQNSIVITFHNEAACAWFGADWEWTDRRLQASLDITSQEIRGLIFRIGEEVRSPGMAGKALVEFMTAQVAIELSRYFRGIDTEKAAGGLSPWRLKLIEERLLSDISTPSVLDLAELCNISARHLTRAFRVSRGRSIASYVLEHRMNHAKQMLASGMSINATASAMGFTTGSNFTIAFRRATGETPREYRQRANHNAQLAARVSEGMN